MRPAGISRRTAHCLVAAVFLALSVAVPVGQAQDSAEPKGELKIEGTHIARLLLECDDGHTEEWSRLSGSIKLPVGTYQVRQLRLRDDYTCQPQSLAKLGPIEISTDAPAVLKAGGPLQQSIGITRRGTLLVLSYGLRGIGGEQYTPHSAAKAKFTVYLGDEPIASGAFEYG